MLSIFNKEYNGRTIRIREDKYVCLTDMAIATDRVLVGWTRTDKSKSYLEALSAIVQKSTIELLEVGQGNQPTWGHPKVALRFAQWCSDEFAIQVDSWIDELMTNGTVSIVPLTPLQLAKEQVKLHEALELQAEQIQLLEADNERQSEAIDELFNYSSIIRIAKFNNCSETNFKWSKLKAASRMMGIEVKQVPCPRFVTKNLYAHDAWRFAYPEAALPDVTTMTIY